MSDVYVLVGDTDHEGSDCIRAFLYKKKADAFLDKVLRHHSKKPQIPMDAEYDSPEMKAYQTEEDAWIKAHPAGKFHYRDFFQMICIPLSSAPSNDRGM